MLSTNIPDLEVAFTKLDQANILADGRDSVQSCIVVRVVQALYLLKKSSFAGIVEPKKEDGVFYESRAVSYCIETKESSGVPWLTLFAGRM